MGSSQNTEMYSIFTILRLVQLHTHNSLTELAISMKLRVYRFLDGKEWFVNNLVFVKQQTASGNTKANNYKYGAIRYYWDIKMVILVQIKLIVSTQTFINVVITAK